MVLAWRSHVRRLSPWVAWKRTGWFLHRACWVHSVLGMGAPRTVGVDMLVAGAAETVFSSVAGVELVGDLHGELSGEQWHGYELGDPFSLFDLYWVVG